ncbi:DUF3293 domain-containing protein [Panacagrimonas sp.]|uniref:DUF3293 domain-containing protein n=1 Tax=Panacagrimonas sp. TaxID=2480088 RepID=UPI003B52BBA1
METEPSPPLPRAAPTSVLDPQLILTYRTARYRVFDPPAGFALGVDAFSSRLAALVSALPVRAAALITACNPGGELRTVAENRVAMMQLRGELRGRCARLLDAENSGAGGDWVEPSVLVLGIARIAALELGRRWGQNAILYAGADAVPRLELLR